MKVCVRSSKVKLRRNNQFVSLPAFWTWMELGPSRFNSRLVSHREDKIGFIRHACSYTWFNERRNVFLHLLSLKTRHTNEIRHLSLVIGGYQSHNGVSKLYDDVRVWRGLAVGGVRSGAQEAAGSSAARSPQCVLLQNHLYVPSIHFYNTCGALIGSTYCIWDSNWFLTF